MPPKSLAILVSATAVLSACVTTAPPTRSRESAALPSLVQKHIDLLHFSCRNSGGGNGGQARPLPGFITQSDLNGDGLPDYVMDAGKFNCSKSMWNDMGAPLTVYLAKDANTVVQGFEQHHSGLRINRSVQPVRIEVSVTRGDCGQGADKVPRQGIAACDRAVVWDAQRKRLALGPITNLHYTPYVPPVYDKRPAPQVFPDGELKAIIGQAVPKRLGDASLVVEEGEQTHPNIRMYWWGKTYVTKQGESVVPRAFATADARGQVLAIHQLTPEQQKKAGEVIACNLNGTADDRRFWIGINAFAGNSADAMDVYAVDRRTGHWTRVPKPYGRFNCSEM